MSSLKEFLAHFKTVEEIIAEDPNAFPSLLYKGFWSRNDNKCRLELTVGDPARHKMWPPESMVVAWINYEALGDNPKEVFDTFLKYRLGTRVEE